MSIANKLEIITDAVYKKGKNDEQKSFWDTYQKKGAQVSNLQYAFAYSHWDDSIYNPKYAFRITYSAGNMYYSSAITDTKVDIDLSLCSVAGSMFRSSKIKTIRKLKVPETLKYEYSFSDCKYLENITFEGVIGNHISFVDSPLLTVESMLNIISCLKDLSGTDNVLICTLGQTNLNKLTDEQKAIATEKGWTLA